MGIGAHGRRIMAALEDGRPARRHDGGWRVGVLDAPDSLIAELTRADLVDAAAGGLALTAAGRGFTARTARPEAVSLTAANKRVANILRKSGETPPAEVDVSLLSVAALAGCTKKVKEQPAPAVDNGSVTQPTAPTASPWNSFMSQIKKRAKES